VEDMVHTNRALDVGAGPKLKEPSPKARIGSLEESLRVLTTAVTELRQLLEAADVTALERKVDVLGRFVALSCEECANCKKTVHDARGQDCQDHPSSGAFGNQYCWWLQQQISTLVSAKQDVRSAGY
jgi:hypothetical protein